MTEKREKVLQQDEQFLKNAYKKAVLPCILSMLSGNINILVDGILVGQKAGSNSLAAINLCVPVYLVLCVIGSFLVSGTAITAAQAIGDNRTEQAVKLYQTAVTACLAASFLVTAAGMLNLKALTVFLCSDDEAMPYVASYASITLAGALPKIMIYIPFWFLRLDGRGGSVSVMMGVMAGSNILLDLLFLYVFDLGVFGAGLASVIATAAAAVIGFALLCDEHSSFQPGLALICEKECWKQISLAGSPSAANNLFQTLRLLAVNSLLMKSGGSSLVAAFTAVNCISAFAGCITDGVPQAASAMLGIYSGEHDNNSTRLLLLREWKSGCVYCILFSAAILAGADLISGLYGLDISLRFPMFCLATGLFPALWNSILSGYYNLCGRIFWANALIFLRFFLAAAGSLYLLTLFQKNPWWFLSLSEIVTILLWYLATLVYHNRHPEDTRYLLMDCGLEREGCVLNFSVGDDVEQICEASSRITDFCRMNGMHEKQMMRMSLAIEEIMTLIVQINGGNGVSFDVRAFALQGVIGIRFRYNGIDFNPFQSFPEQDEQYMGIRMVKTLVGETVYQRTFGMNTLQILL